MANVWRIKGRVNAEDKFNELLDFNKGKNGQYNYIFLKASDKGFVVGLTKEKSVDKKLIRQSQINIPVYSYSREQALQDGVLMKNPKQDRFPECDIITVNLFNKIKKLSFERTMKRVFEVDTMEILGSLMLFANDMYSKKKFKGDNNKDFFVLPPTEEGVVVWFVRNENGKLTAMLPEDY